MEFGILLICFTIALCTYTLLSGKSGTPRPDPFIGRSKLFYILAASLFAIAILARVYQFGAVPSGLNQDGAMAAVDAKALADYGTDRFGMRYPAYFTAWDYGQMSVLMSYMMVPFIKLFGLTVVTARLPMLLASLAGVTVIFLFAKKAFGMLPALVALAFAAINPWHIMQSRWALECNLFPHMLLFSLYFLYLGLDKKVFLYISMVFFGLTMYTYGIAFYTTPILMIVLCVYFVAKKRIKLWEAGACAAVYLIFAWPIFAVVAVNMFKLQTIDTGFITIPYFPNSIRTKDLILYSDDILRQLPENLDSFVNMVILDKGDFTWSYIKNYGHMYLFTLPFVIVGLWYLFRGRKAEAGGELPLEEAAPEPTARFILGAWLAVSLFSGLMVNNVNTNRINIVFYPMILLASLGIWRAVTHTPYVRRVAIAVSVLYAVSFGSFTYAYFGEHAKALAKDFCSGLTDAIRYADNLDTDVLYITTYSRSENAYTCSEIYTLFGAELDAHYFQGVAGAANRSTGKALLPYKERYQYIDFESFAFDKPAGAVYVYNIEEESSLFDTGEYELMPFGNFGVAVQTQDSAPAEEDILPEEEEIDDSGDGETVG